MRTHPITRRRFIEMLGMAVVASAVGTQLDDSPLRHSLRAQLRDAGRVTNLEGARLTISTLEEMVYALRRSRMASSPHHTELTVDCLSEPVQAERFKNVLHASLYNRFGAFEIKEGVALINEEMPFVVCDMANAGCQLALISAPIPTGQLWFLDWADLAAGFSPARIEAEHPTNHLIIENVGGFIA